LKQSPYLRTASLGLGVSVRTVCTQELPRARELTVGCGSLEAWPRTDRRWRGVLVVLRRVHIYAAVAVGVRVSHLALCSVLRRTPSLLGSIGSHLLPPDRGAVAERGLCRQGFYR